MRGVAQLAEIGIDERLHGEREPDLHLGAALVVEREHLVQQRARLRVRAERLHPLAHALDDELHREAQQLRARLEVVAQRAGRPAGLGGHATHGRGVDPFPHDELPDGARELGAALLVIDHLWHRGCILAQVC